jgi:hypothetical protein
MLTRDDLQQMREVVREEIKGEISFQLKPVSQKLSRLDRKLNRLKKDIIFIVHDYGNAVSHLRKRADRIEDHLDLSEV